jgi:hypothetical protein
MIEVDEEKRSSMKLNVFFFGLICHVSQDDDPGFADHAALVKAADHVPLLIWRDSAGTAHGRSLQGGGEIQFGVDDDAPAPGRLTRHGLFRQSVVRLADILPDGARIKADVQNRSNVTDVAAYVVFPAAAEMLRIGDFYPAGGRIRKPNGGGHPHECIPRIIMVTIHAETRVSIIGAGDPLVFEEDACVLFSNAEPRQEDTDAAETERNDGGEVGRQGNDIAAARRPCHTVHYGNISDAPVEVICEQTNQPCHMSFIPEECGWVSPFVQSLRVLASEFVECANTQWP